MKFGAPRLVRTAPLCAVSAAIVCLGLLGCGGSKAPSSEITDVKPATQQDATTPPELTTKQRLRVRDMVPTGHGDAAGDDHAGHDHEKNPHDTAPAAGGDVPAGPGGDLAYTLPAGWTDAGATPMRPVNLKVGAASECYVAILGGDGGGLASNLNRWREQMGQAELPEADIAALPKKPLLGKEATLITIDGSFTGMGESTAREGYRMLGLASVADGRAVFVKLTGPQAEVEKEAANFDAFCASLKDAAPTPAPAPAAAPATAAPAETPAPAPAAPAATPAASMPAPAAGGSIDASKLQWSAPPSWTQGPEKMMRVVTYNVGKSECYITVLDGQAGGADANLNRWRNQMSMPPLKAEEVAQLPKISILGKDAYFLEAKGDFTTMGGEMLSGQMLLGALLLTDNAMLTVKMTGPEAEVAAELENFKSFCASIASN